MSDDTKVADLPASESLSDVLREMRSDPHPSRRWVHVLADRIEAALARQEADEMAALAGQTYVEDHPEHSRTSCSDANPCNADPDGSGCARCTALVMDRANVTPHSAPVGLEPVRYVRWHPEHGYRWEDTSSDFHGDYSRTGWTSKALYAAPPAAQAVDLGQFRGAVEAYKAAVNEDCYFDPSDYDDNIAYADRLLALIDQQAGKAGGA